MTTDADIIRTARRVGVVTNLAALCTHKLIQKLNDHSNGFPATREPVDIAGDPEKPGAGRWCDLDQDELGHESASKTTTTEQAALNRDEARRIKQRYARIIENIDRHTVELENILGSWLNGTEIDISAVPDPDPEEEIWCPNHLRADMHEPKAPGRKFCRWCYEFQLAHDSLLPPKDLMILRGWKTRINETDVAKSLAALEERRTEERRLSKKRKTAA